MVLALVIVNFKESETTSDLAEAREVEVICHFLGRLPIAPETDAQRPKILAVRNEANGFFVLPEFVEDQECEVADLLLNDIGVRNPRPQGNDGTN